MIKTEIESSEEVKTAPNISVSPITKKQFIVFTIVICACLLAVIGYLLSGTTSGSVPKAKTSNLGSVPALPLAGSSSVSVSPAGSNPSSDSQSSSNLNNLNASSINLQNNVPSGQGSAQSSSLQSTGQAQSTGQSINTTQPY